MELKTKYQYTYFIYPYIINKKEYDKYLQRLITDAKFKMKIFDKKKDEDLYSYFLPKIRETLFWTMDYNQYRLSKFDELDQKMRATVLSKYPCTMFEYNLQNDIQGKAGKKDGIFFNITNINLICFNTGICFLLMKTILEEESTIADLCNFNYKFRDIKSETYDFRGYENIKIQTDKFNSIKEITTLITEITGSNKEISKLNLDTDRFITYSYACIGQEDWNENTNNELLEKEFYKLANVENADYIVNSGNNGIKNKMSTIEKSKNEIYGFSNVGTVLITSDINSENCTKLPHKFERQYLYQYIFELYKKIYLKKINYDFKKSKRLNNTKQELVNFTQVAWIEEITNDNIGSLLDTQWRKTLKLDTLYLQVKNKYDLFYKNSNIEKTAQINKMIVIILILLLIMNVISICRLF